MEYKKVLFIFVGILAVALLAIGLFASNITTTVFAGDFIEGTTDNVKVYDSNTKIATLKDKNENDIATVQLLTSLNNEVGAGNSRFAEYEVCGKFNYEELFYGGNKLYDKKEFDKGNLNLDGREIELKYLTTKTVNDENGSHSEEFWMPFDEKINPKKDECTTIGLYANVLGGEYMEWIPKFAGLEISEWASFFVRTITTDGGWATQGETEYTCQGMLIDANRDFYITNFTKPTSHTSTRGLIINLTGEDTIAYGDFVGNVVEFDPPALIKSGARIYVCSKAPSGYTSTYKSGHTGVTNDDFTTYARAWGGTDGDSQTEVTNIYATGQTGYYDGIISIGTTDELPTPVVNCSFSGYAFDENDNALENANISILNQLSPSEYYTDLTDSNGYWAINITNSTNTYMIGAYFNNSLIGQLKPYVSGQC